MNPKETDQDTYDQPVAYDAQGQPLYAHPPAAEHVVHIARDIDPVKQQISDETKKRHDISHRIYPMLNLSESEYIIAALRRHPIGLIIPLALGTLLIAVALIVLSNYQSIVTALNIDGQLAQTSTIAIPLLLFCGVVILGMFIAYYVYVNNRFYLTNESVIQEVQMTLFARHEQTVSLGNVEDASYYQEGIFQDVFNYGTIRLSTQGDETTYTFTYAGNPKERVATLNNAVEAFKNGRPVTD